MTPARLRQALLTARLGNWTAATSVLPALLGLLLPVGFRLWAQGPDFALPLLAMLAATLLWQAAFALLRRRGIGLDGLVTGALFALLLPADAPLWQAMLGLSFGVVLAEQVFGGRGRNFVHPVVVGLAFLMFSFPDGSWRATPDIPLLAALPALALLLVSGQASWRVLLPAVVAFWLVVLGQGGAPKTLLANGGIVLALVFLLADPVTSAATNPGRWLHGALVGALAGLFAGGSEPFGAVVFAILLGSILAPLIDSGVIAVHTRRRRSGHG